MKQVFLWILSCTFSVSLCGQADTAALHAMQGFVSHIEAFNRLYPQEKTYLHFDNTAYYLGETIWFAAYVVNAAGHTPTTGSGVLYVELLNSRGILLETKKLKITDGRCHGSFYLSPFNYDYHAGFYEVRAYTKMMLNAGAETVFSRVFPVFNPAKDGSFTGMDRKHGGAVSRLNLPWERKKPKKAGKVNVDFYPEGGNLINGLSNRVAFKATDENGVGIDVEGKLLNPEGGTICSFSTVHGGMGSFYYSPDGNKNRVQVRYKNKTYRFDLPKSNAKGFALTVNGTVGKHLALQVEKSAGTPSIPLGLSILCRGRVVHFLTLTPADSPVTFRIAKEELPAGVNQITLFDAKGEVFAERLVFVSPPENTLRKIKATPDKPAYKPRERIVINIESLPETTFSLSVRNASKEISVPDKGNLLTTLLLSSDLKGFVENPSYYFGKKENKRLLALDLLMLVQGWRRYEWQTMAGVKSFEQRYDLEKGLKVKGAVAGKAKEVRIELTLDGGLFVEGEAKVDSAGHFSTDIDTVFYGDRYMLLSAPGLKKADRNIRLDKWFSPSPKTYSFGETQASDDEEEETPKESDLPEDGQSAENEEPESKGIDTTHEIEELEVVSRRGKDLVYNVERDREKDIDAGLMYPMRAHEYLVEKKNGYFSRPAIEDLPNNTITGCNSFYWGLYGFDLRYVVDGKRWVRIEENPKYRHEEGLSAALIKLESIQQITIREWEKTVGRIDWEPRRAISAYLYPYTGTTYSGYRKNPDYRVTTFQGYSIATDFYTGRPEREDYLPGKKENPRTLYWNPEVKTDSQGKARISFHNNYFCREIRVSAEGISGDGDLISDNQ